MLRDEADCRADHERFIRRAIEAGTVWQLEGEGGCAVCESDDGEQNVLLFWSDRAYAERARTTHFPDLEPAEVSLFDFMFRWLPGMAGDGVLVGTNWTGDLVGLEHDPQELLDELTDAMPEATLDGYVSELRKGLAAQQGGEDAGLPSDESS